MGLDFAKRRHRQLHHQLGRRRCLISKVAPTITPSSKHSLRRLHVRTPKLLPQIVSILQYMSARGLSIHPSTCMTLLERTE